MKRRLAGILLFALLLGVTACGKTEEESAPNHVHEENTGAAVKLIVGLAAGEDELHYSAAEQFESQIELQTEGEVDVILFGSNQLGSDDEMIQSLMENDGKVDILISPVENFTKLEPKMDISALPFLFHDYDEAQSFMNGEVQQEAAGSLLNHNIRVLTYYSNGFESIITKDKVIKDTREMQDLKIAADSFYGLEAMRIAGVREVKKETEDVRSQLQNGMLDGYAGNVSDIYNRHLYSNMNYINITRHSYEAVAFAVSESTWQSLDKDLREIVQQAAINSAYTNIRDMENAENNMLHDMEEKGVHIVYPMYEDFQSRAANYVEHQQDKYENLVHRLFH